MRHIEGTDDRPAADILVTRVDVCDEASFRATGVLDLYRELFPPHERDDPDDIVRWVLTDDVGEQRCFAIDGRQMSYRLDSRYVTLRAEGRTIGLGFFTYDHTSRLIYCNYVGVHRDWRRGGMAREFYRETIKLFDSELFTDNLGVVLEVEPFDGDSLERIIADLERSGERRLAEHDQETVRKFLRITWYDKLGYSFFVDARNGQPLSCRSPCLDPQLPRAAWAGEEAGYWLMWHGHGAGSDAHHLWRTAVETIYVEILAKSLVAEDAQRRRDYWEYATGLVAHTLRATEPDGVGLGSYLGPDDRPWLPRWRQLGIDLPI